VLNEELGGVSKEFAADVASGGEFCFEFMAHMLFDNLNGSCDLGIAAAALKCHCQ
jgi:hypothetical protein